MAWTPQQQQAIDQRGKNILVSAAAGSGKTAVLVERIKKLVAEEGVPIDRMLIVTFTNAAASEMKEKIRATLKNKLKDSPQLKEQLDLLPGASISTFHSFALDVIRQYFYLIDLEPGFAICDDAQSIVIKEDALDTLLEERFEEGSEEFYSFLDWYGSEKSIDEVRNIIDKTYTALQSLPEPFETLDAKVRELALEPSDYKNTPAMRLMSQLIIEDLEEARDCAESAEALLEDNCLERMMALFAPELEAFRAMYEYAATEKYDELKSEIDNFPSIRMSASGDEKPVYKEISGSFKALRDTAKGLYKGIGEKFFAASIDSQLADVKAVSGKAVTLQKLIIDFDRIFKEAKAEKALLDFNDIEHYCLEILKDKQVSDYYKEKFKYVFIDEYQDTSLLQEAIIGRIKGDDNLFMVGDIKQSIYKFRLAEPEIFKSKYDTFAKDTNGKSTKIDLNKNFRSKKVILDSINDVFEPVMEGYDDDARLYNGIDYDGEYSFAPVTRIIDSSSESEDEDENLEELKDADKEALEICNIIKENLGREYFNSKEGKVKRISYRDIVILMRSAKNYAGAYYQIMRDNGIPLYVDDNDGYFDTMEINVFMNLLSVLDNKYQDVPFLSTLRSEIFGFTTDELAEIRANNATGSYVAAFTAYAENSGGNADLQNKCQQVFDQLKRWKSLSLAMPLPKFIWKLMLETGYYIVMGAMPQGAQRQANLRALVDKAENFSSSGQTSLYSFVRYIDTVKQKEIKTGQVRLLGEKDDVVRIMTVHKSKGLEFPMVIVAGMGRKLMYGKADGKVLFHKDVGLGMFFEDVDKHIERKTLPYNIILRQVHREEYEEQIRVLYVALTRARDILYLTGTVKDGQKLLDNKELGVSSDSTYFNMLSYLPDPEIISGDTLQMPESDETAKRSGDINYAGMPSDEQRTMVKSRLEYEYPFASAREVRSKYSVSSLNAAGHQTVVSYGDIKLPEPSFRQESRPLTGAEKGTIYHGIMERIDFSRAVSEGLDYVRSAADSFVQSGIFLQEEINAIDFGRIERFFESEIGKRCAKAFEDGRLRREEPFDIKWKLNGEDVIVQGIIDCYFEEDGKIVLLDYKTNWIDESKPFEEEKKRLQDTYRTQLEIYGQALTKASGKPVAESYLYLFSAGRLIEVN